MKYFFIILCSLSISTITTNKLKTGVESTAETSCLSNTSIPQTMSRVQQRF